MAQPGYTPILLYGSGTPAHVPLAANMASNSSGAELALNYADGKLFFKNSSGVVTLLATAAGSVGGITITNDTSTATTVYPAFVDATGGTCTTIYTSDPNYQYIPSTGTLIVPRVSTGGLNITIGLDALLNNTTGVDNTAIGIYALTVNTTGSHNTAIGAYAMYFNITGNQNTAVGQEALYQNDSGSYNSAFGELALSENLSGSYNTALGYNAGAGGRYTSFDTAVGFGALGDINVTGFGQNTAIGKGALYTTTGSFNTALGNGAGGDAGSINGNTTGNSNVYIGYAAIGSAVNNDNEMVLGANAVGVGSNTTVIGNPSTTSTVIYGNLSVPTGAIDGVFNAFLLSGM